ncbi:lanthionine synthetase C family protein [Gracilibacillus sp. HCP3S3_G5_1]|uniref:lanthionine synthetase C family protein n=1 Tax=unclassified Gracilibacillus TaxID=2625209 RepID=UPI003F88EE07
MDNTTNTVLIEMCLEKVKKFKDPDRIKSDNIIGDLEEKDLLSIAYGYPGIIVMFAELDAFFPNEGWDKVTHEYMKNLKKLLEQNSISDISLFHGLAGINYSVQLASKKGTRYQKIIKELDTLLINKASFFLMNVKKINSNLELGTSEFGYDLITGITGIGTYILKFKKQNLYPLLKDILTFLIELSTNIKTTKGQVPAFITSPKAMIVESDRVKYPNGYLNLGIAHGISGPLALLSRAYLEGITVKEHLSSIIYISNLLSDHFNFDKNGLYIQRIVTLEQMLEEQRDKEKETRFDAWCYGGFGVSYSLLLAYQATYNTKIKYNLIELLKGILSCSIEEWSIKTPILCHGYAGNMQIINRLLSAEEISQEKNVVKELINKRSELYNRINEYYESNPEKVNISLLEGDIGVILVLLSISRLEYVHWDGFLLLS